MEVQRSDDASVDVIISNCVINLSPDKGALFTEMLRVLVPGGRIGRGAGPTEDPRRGRR